MGDHSFILGDLLKAAALRYPSSEKKQRALFMHGCAIATSANISQKVIVGGAIALCFGGAIAILASITPLIS